MSSNENQENDKKQKTTKVASRCIAIVLKKTKGKKSRHEGFLFERKSSKDVTKSDASGGCLQTKDVNGKDIWDDFKLRNATCYWNASLLESIRSLEFYGFVEPFTLLAGGNEGHLENLRSAWGRRVLKPPRGYEVIKIGDVSGIEMEEVPQTQFIPLPDAMCLVILELNNTRVVATVDTIKEKLKKCYSHMHLPEDWLLVSTLADLIRDSKIFYNGCGYFVVTPDTFYVPPADPSLAWLPYHAQQQQMQSVQQMAHYKHMQASFQTGCFSGQPIDFHREANPLQANFTNNICVGHAQQNECAHHNIQKATKSACCQTEDANNKKACKSVNRKSELPDVIEECELPADTKIGRRNSFRDKKKSGEQKRNVVKRSSSLREANEKIKKRDEIPGRKDVPEPSKGTRPSLFSKLFGKNKNKKEKETEKTTVPPSVASNGDNVVVEYATFSAQFPPIDCQWQYQQMNKHDRVKAWVKTQINTIDEQSVVSKRRHGERRSNHRKREGHKTGNSKAVCPHDHAFTRNDHNKENYAPRKPPRGGGGGGGGDECCSDVAGSQVLPLHSTPIYRTNHHHPSQPCQRCQCSSDMKTNPYPHKVKHRSSKHLEDNTFPSSVSQMSDCESRLIGKMPPKNSVLSESRDSGVNCVADSNQKHCHGNRKYKAGKKPSRHNSMVEGASSVKARGFVPIEFKTNKYFVEPVFSNASNKEIIYENLRDLRRQSGLNFHQIRKMSPVIDQKVDDGSYCAPAEQNIRHELESFKTDGKLVFDRSHCESEVSCRTAIHVTLAEVHSPGNETPSIDTDHAIVDSGLGNSEEGNFSENAGNERVNAFDNKFCDGVYFSKPCNSLKDINNAHEVNDVNTSTNDVPSSPDSGYEKLSDGPILIQKSQSANVLNNQKPKCNQKTNNLVSGSKDDILANNLDMKTDIEELKQSIQKLNFPRDFEVVGIL